jgi:hypothetical protein
MPKARTLRERVRQQARQLGTVATVIGREQTGFAEVTGGCRWAVLTCPGTREPGMHLSRRRKHSGDVRL